MTRAAECGIILPEKREGEKVFHDNKKATRWSCKLTGGYFGALSELQSLIRERVALDYFFELSLFCQKMSRRPATKLAPTFVKKEKMKSSMIHHPRSG